jgi:WD40 repeat protein
MFRMTRLLERSKSIEVSVATIAAQPSALAWSASGHILAVATDRGEIVLLSAVTGGLRQRIRAHAGPVRSIAWHPRSDALVTTGHDGAVRLWESPFATSTELIGPGEASGHAATPRGLSFSHDGRWLATADDATISLWPFDRRGPEGRAPVRLAGHEAIVTALAFAPLVDLLLSGSQDGVVALWAPPKLTTPAYSARLTGRITQLAWGADVAGQVLRWAAADAHGRVMIGQV